jgi:hypothetical protein
MPVSRERQLELKKLREVRKQLARKEYAAEAEASEDRGFIELTPDDLTLLSLKPHTRADCSNVPRPCPYVSCKHNLALDVSPCGTIRQRKPVENLPEHMSCALDAAEEEGLTSEEIGIALGVTRQRADQLLEQAIRHARLKNVLQVFR